MNRDAGGSSGITGRILQQVVALSIAFCLVGATAGRTPAAASQHLVLDLQCQGSGVHTSPGESNDRDLDEQASDNDGNPDCINPLSNPEDVFVAIVTNNRGAGVEGISVKFSFGQRTNGNAAGANNSTDDATLDAAAGGQIGTDPSGQQTFCTTDSRGRCSATLTNPTPQARDTIVIVAAISSASDPGQPTDSATKQWQTGVVNTGGTLTLTPRAATNQVGTQHTVIATVTNQFGQPVQGANVDFYVASGPNAGLAQAGMTDAVTDANGAARFTYTSNAAGTDELVACSETGGTENDTCSGGEPNDTAYKTWQTGPVTTSAIALDMDADDGGKAGSTGNPGACELDTATDDPDRESSATNVIDPANETAPGNFHRICAAAFQNGQQTNSGRIGGAAISFTISGPGRIYPATEDNACDTRERPPERTSVTVTADQGGFAFACLYSQKTGHTTVTAASGDPAQTAEGTKRWTSSAGTRHDRAIGIRFAHSVQGERRLVVLGKLTLVGTDDFKPCVKDQPVKVQRRVGGKWVTKKSTHTDRRGRYTVQIADRRGRYRAIAPKTTHTVVATDTTHICARTRKAARHTHA